MHCSNCGISIDNETVFCPNCGTKVERNIEKPNQMNINSNLNTIDVANTNANINQENKSEISNMQLTKPTNVETKNSNKIDTIYIVTVCVLTIVIVCLVILLMNR